MAERLQRRLLPFGERPFEGRYDPQAVEQERAVIGKLLLDQINTIRENIIPPRLRPEDPPRDITLGILEPDIPIMKLFRKLRKPLRKAFGKISKQDTAKKLDEAIRGLGEIRPTEGSKQFQGIKDRLEGFQGEPPVGFLPPPVAKSTQAGSRPRRNLTPLGEVPDLPIGGRPVGVQETIPLTASERFLRQPARNTGLIEYRDVITSSDARRTALNKRRETEIARRVEAGQIKPLERKPPGGGLPQGRTRLNNPEGFLLDNIYARGGIYDTAFFGKDDMARMNKQFRGLFSKDSGKTLEELGAGDVLEDYLGRKIEPEELFDLIKTDYSKRLNKEPRARGSEYRGTQTFENDSLIADEEQALRDMAEAAEALKKPRFDDEVPF